MRQWLVAGGLIEAPEGLLLVQNRRRNGSTDWSTPGGVIEVAEGESLLDGLTREVHEETGITVTEWEGPVYEVEAVAEGLGWVLQVEVHRAVAFTGDLHIDDPDGIVIDAQYVPVGDCVDWLESNALWVREPLAAWLGERWSEPRSYRYRVDGRDRAEVSVVRL